MIAEWPEMLEDCFKAQMNTRKWRGGRGRGGSYTQKLLLYENSDKQWEYRDLVCLYRRSVFLPWQHLCISGGVYEFSKESSLWIISSFSDQPSMLLRTSAWRNHSESRRSTWDQSAPQPENNLARTTSHSENSLTGSITPSKQTSQPESNLPHPANSLKPRKTTSHAGSHPANSLTPRKK